MIAPKAVAGASGLAASATISGAVLILGDAPQSYRLIAAAVLMLIIAGIDITLAVASVRLRPGP